MGFAKSTNELTKYALRSIALTERCQANLTFHFPFGHWMLEAMDWLLKMAVDFALDLAPELNAAEHSIEDAFPCGINVVNQLCCLQRAGRAPQQQSLLLC